MIYIHKLEQLVPGIADIESVPLIRDIKRETSFPFQEDLIKRKFSGFFIKEFDISLMQEALQHVQPAVDELQIILDKKDSEFEDVNILRTLKLIDEMPHALGNNIAYLQEILGWQEEFVKEITAIFNGIVQVKNHDELLDLNKRLNLIFFKLLRDNEFTFKFNDLIHEAHVEHINDLKTILPQGFLFKITIEEEINKIDFNVIRRRISRGNLDNSDRVWSRILEIKKGVDKAYQINMKMVEWVVMLYSYVKFLKTR
ncbi:MAG TPA: hypothetical protein VJJ21_00815 [Candidatus Nanoarchaeia archaeon]|nr:hypothetical protein [Candidatus Nanoarchaeia archaeon]